MESVNRKKDRTSLIEELERYQPFNEQEEADRTFILNALRSEPELFLRTSPAMHMTASGWVVNQTHDRILMAYHNIYDSWSWLGGHADGEEDLSSVALREVKEESGIEHAVLLSDEPFSLEVLTVDGHEKNDSYVSSHLHLNITYLIEADDRQALHVRETENRGVSWFEPAEAVKASSEPWFRERIYAKLNRRLNDAGILK